MRTRTLAAFAATAVVFLTAGCSGSSEPRPEPASARSSASATPKLSSAEATRQCVNAMADRIAADSEFDPYVDTPFECAQVPEGDLMDAYMDGLHQVNQTGRDDLQKRIDEAEQQDAGE